MMKTKGKGLMFKMAHQQIVCVFTVLIILLCQACGGSVINSRIIGGQDASPGSWPWHATFEYLGQIFCQGSLINNQWVLTAAQCSLGYNFSGSVVHLGMQSQTGFNPNEVNRTIDSFILHEDFNYDFNNDICLVKLSAPVSFTNYIQPVSLASENSTFYDGTSCWVTGFGDSQSWHQLNTLQEVNIPIIGNSKCSCLYNTSFLTHYVTITDSVMCAGGENGLKGLSNGDLGAALVTKNDSIWIQIGIAKFTYGIYFDKPGVYTRVSQYQKWISDRLTGIEPGFDTFTSTASDSDFNYTCSMSPPTTPYAFLASSNLVITTTPNTTTDGSTFSSSVKVTHLMSLLFCSSMSLLALV